MKLSTAQDERLDRLSAMLEREAYGEALAILEELALAATPALVPQLLPAFVPRSLRLAQLEPRWRLIHRGAARPLDISAAEAPFREALAGVLAKCLAVARVDDIVWLDEASRRHAFTRWLTSHWGVLGPREVEGCLPAHPAHRTVVLSLATFHPDGHVRQRAIALLDEVSTGEELPFLLLRLNDWVGPVQSAARNAVHGRIREDYAPHFARWLVLLNRLLDAQRNQLSKIVEWAHTLLLTPTGRLVLATQYEAHDRFARRAALQLAGARLEGEERWDVLRRAFRDSDAGTRMWAARIACEERRYFTELQDDPCGCIRVWALRARMEQEQEAALPALRAALLDPAATVRSCAKFHLSRLDPGFSVASLYRGILDEQSAPPLLASAIAGLAEVGDRDDAALIALHFKSRSARVAKAAIRTCARLARVDCLADFVRALSDERAGVSKEACAALRLAWVSPVHLQALVRAAEHTHTRLSALVLVGQLERGDKLIGLLEAAANDRAPVRDASLRGLECWLSSPGAHRRSLAREQCDRALGLLENVSHLELREQVRRALLAE